MMYIECQKGKNGKPYYFLRESKRVGKRIIKTTLLNITPWGEMFCEQFKTFLKNRQSLLSAVAIDSVSTVTDKEEIHSRYKDLSMVENAFRTMKTINLEMRPLYVRKKSRTRGHAFVVMLSFLIIKELRNCWINDEVTPKEGIQLLRELCIVEAKVCS